uniref:ORF11 n=1 Tax=Nitrosopumilaceae spindle-shaped virus TaxID=3065433 RepID=A0AAT9JGQ7_9VIRU
MVFPYTTSPDDTVVITVSLPRWINDWKKDHKSINFSGLCQEILVQLMKERDIEYFEANKQYLQNEIRRKETTPIPNIY